MTPIDTEALRTILATWAAERHQRLFEDIAGTLQAAGIRNQPDAELVDRLVAALPHAPAANAEGPGIDRELGAALDLLEGATSQSEALRRLLDGLDAVVERCALYVIKQGIPNLYSWRGFEGTTAKAGSPVVPPADLEELLAGRQAWLGKGPGYQALLAPLARMEAAEARIFPLRLKRKPVALLLVDSGMRQTLDHHQALRALAQAASATLGSLAGAKEEEKAPPPVDHPTLPTMLVQDPIPEPAAPALDPKVRATAERFARVLAGDIELYFPAKVEQARTQGNLYGLLRDELDRSRHSFVERFGEEMEVSHGIFGRAIIELLCEGDAGRLGAAPWA
ncbi:MAG: hypothetical protein HYZ13_09525 [Acidobacteria bacterium]|nr:hypothetical protein [Acidobacteriota bacterium]